MSDCVFCKIISGEIPSHKIYEDEEFLAFLDIKPNTKGQAVLVTKKHYSSYAFDLPDDVYERLMKTAKKVVKLLDEKLGVQRTGLVHEGMGINHAHVKLYPLHNTEEFSFGKKGGEKVYFEKYPGYLTTEVGPEADQEKLRKLAERIRE